MKDLEILLENKPVALATREKYVAIIRFASKVVVFLWVHFLVKELQKARKVLAEAGIEVVKLNEVLK